MQNNEGRMDSGFKIVTLLMVESNFYRAATVTFDADKIERIVNVSVKVQLKDDNTIQVLESIEYRQQFDNINEVYAKITMVGVFQKIGNANLDLEKFGKVNGAAIIFPYLREHLSNLSSKAGIELIVLPPYNFTKG